MTGVFLGIDVGSTTVKLVALDHSRRLLSRHYVRSNGQPRSALLRIGREVLARLPPDSIRGVGLCGSGGRPIADLVGGMHANELVTQTRAIGVLQPEARTVIEIGGQDSKFLSVQWHEPSRRMLLIDFSMNALCAAGTGAFLDQQAERLGIDIDGEFARIALQSEHPARVAGRCTVFAKSDLIHLQQQGTPLCDLLLGLCHALARNYKSVIAKGRPFTPPLLFQGGVAHNAAVKRAFEEVLGLPPGSIVVPRHHDVMAAFGAALLAADEFAEGRPSGFRGFESLREEQVDAVETGSRVAALRTRLGAAGTCFAPVAIGPAEGLEVALGVDVGSISTNVVVVDEAGRIVARRYLPTAGRPIEAVRRALDEVGREVGEHVVVQASGCTGSGRFLAAAYVGADLVVNEITAQAHAAAATDPDVDTVIEIGGQDSKFIRLQDGVVVDFAMNNACAAGTGSFLEEQAGRLDMDIVGEFAGCALRARNPVALGERCTVFIESDLVHHQQRGASTDDLAAGLAYSIVHNYLDRVVNGRPIGARIAFQGGVAGNAAVAAAFEAVLGRPITVPPHHDVTGAIGAALLAREARERTRADRTAFRGFDVAERATTITRFVCRHCANHCEIQRVVVAGAAPLHFGSRCGRHDPAFARERRRPDEPDLFAERERLLLGDWTPPDASPTNKLRVGIPRALVFHELFPWWRTFLRALDVDVVLSSPTNTAIARRAAECAATETCQPAKLLYGHVLELLEEDVDLVFLPSILDREDPGPGQPHNHYCLYVSAAPEMLDAHLAANGRERDGARLLKFPFHMQRRAARRRELSPVARAIGRPLRRVLRAAELADQEQDRFQRSLLELGARALTSLRDGATGVVIVGRSYNTCDPAACLDLPRMLRRLGVVPIPMDLLDGRSVDLRQTHPDMYWRSGQSILGTAHLVARDPRLQAIYLTNFQCGPDSFLLGYFRTAMQGKPFLEIELDDHTAEAGMITRCEAFLDSLGKMPVVATARARAEAAR